MSTEGLSIEQRLSIVEMGLEVTSSQADMALSIINLMMPIVTRAWTHEERQHVSQEIAKLAQEMKHDGMATLRTTRKQLGLPPHTDQTDEQG